MDQYMKPLDVKAYKSLSLRMIKEVAPEIRQNVKRYNRYNDILPTPATRLRLNQYGSDPETTYINANYIPFDGKDKAYIAAMGPLTTTIGSFIRMMWEEKVVVCVMTTNFVEKGRKKCERYWPEEPGFVETYDGIQVQSHGVVPSDGYYQTRLRLVKDGEEREVMHFHYNTWPDRGVPTRDDRPFTKPVVRMLAAVRRHRQQTDSCASPMLVHCSAGVGRTGCFILIDQAFRLLEGRKKVDLVKMIDVNRGYRMAFVQTDSQYEYAWQAVAGYVQFRLKSQPAAKAVTVAAPAVATVDKKAAMKVGGLVMTTTNFTNPEGHADTLKFKVGQKGKLLEKTEYWWRVLLEGEEGWILPDHLKPYTSPPASQSDPFAPRPSTSSAEFNPFGLDSSASSVEQLSAKPTPASSVAKPKGITRNPFLQSMKVKPGQNLRAGLKARTEALEQAASMNAMREVVEEDTEEPAKQPTFEEIMNMAMNMDEHGDLQEAEEEEEESFDEADPVQEEEDEVFDEPDAVVEPTMPTPPPRERPLDPFLSTLPPWTYMDANGDLRRITAISTHYKRLASIDEARVRTPAQIVGPAVVSHNQSWIELETGLPAFDRTQAHAIISEC
eukprot:m.92197 g.92197  ORF g.92197 m.92197 type:complete len:611 (+) comp14939_c0_seq1:186-2018(+)